MSAEYVLEMRNITKNYGENTVLSDVTLKVRPGEIHALLGENGAGKSTLMNVLFGMPVIHATGGFGGEVVLDGEKTHISSPHDAMTKGIGMVHQEFMLLPGFTVTENIKLNREVTKKNVVSRLLGRNMETLNMDAMSSAARKALENNPALAAEIEQQIRALSEKTADMMSERDAEEDIEGDDDFDIQLLKDDGLGIDD